MMDYLIGAIMGFLIGIATLLTMADNIHHKAAAKTPCAQFHPETGEFEWLDLEK